MLHNKEVLGIFDQIRPICYFVNAYISAWEYCENMKAATMICTITGIFDKQLAWLKFLYARVETQIYTLFVIYNSANNAFPQLKKYEMPREMDGAWRPPCRPALPRGAGADPRRGAANLRALSLSPSAARPGCGQHRGNTAEQFVAFPRCSAGRHSGSLLKSELD